MIQDNILATVYKVTKKVIDNLNAKRSEFDEKTLNSILAMKVDQADFLKLNELMATKKDTENIIDSVNVLN